MKTIPDIYHFPVTCPLCKKNLTRIAKALGVDAEWLLTHHLAAAHVWPAVHDLEVAVIDFWQKNTWTGIVDVDRVPGIMDLKKALDAFQATIRTCSKMEVGLDPGPAGGKLV